MSQPNTTVAHVHIKHRIARGGYTGPYDFWTFVLENPIASGVAAALLWDITKTLASKALGLLKRATTPAKRVDMVIPYQGDSLAVTRVIIVPYAGCIYPEMPTEREIHEALIRTNQAFQDALQQESESPLAVTAELTIRPSGTDFCIGTHSGGNWPGLETQVAMARAEKVSPLKYDSPEGHEDEPKAKKKGGKKKAGKEKPAKKKSAQKAARRRAEKPKRKKTKRK